MLTVKPHSWTQEEVNDRSVVDIFAHDKDSQSVFLRVVDAPISCYMQLPLRGPNGDFVCWDSIVESIFEYLCKRLGDNAPIDYEFVQREKLFFSEDVTVYPFLRLVFNNTRHMYSCSAYHKHIDLYGGFDVCYWEHDINIITRLQATCKITHTSWFACTGVPLREKITRCQKEYVVNYASIFPIPEEECQSWTIRPLICSWDGEMYSKNHRALPKATNDSDKLYLISANLERLNQPESRQYFVFLYGDCNEPTLPNVTVFRFKDLFFPGDGEVQMLYAFGQFLLERDPDIITGYNINGFDFAYIRERLATRGLSWIYTGRYLQPPPVCLGRNMKSVTDKQGVLYDAASCLFYSVDKVPYNGDSWKSAGRGTINLKYYPMHGRVIIDLLPVIKESHKLDRYDLGFVSRKFINADKNPVTPQEMFKIYEESFSHTPESHAKMTEVVDYCIQDSDLVLDLMRKLDIWTGLSEMSNIVAVSIEDTYMRGQQQRCVNLLFKAVFEKNIVFDRLKGDCEGYAGGSVDDPVPGFYARLMCMDFKSLYPSIIIYYQLCYRSCIPRKFWHLYPIEDCNVCKFVQQEAVAEEPEFLSAFTDSASFRKKDRPTHPVEHEYRFYKKRTTILPDIEKNLIARRRATIRMASQFAEYSMERNVLDKRQLALKIQANSFYGFLGVPYDKGGKCPCFEIARSVTAYGRMSKKLLGDYIQATWGGEIVYGDTDSCMVRLPQVEKNEDCQEWGERIAQVVSGYKAGDPLPGYGYRSKKFPEKVHEEGAIGIFHDPMAIEFEKAMDMVVFCKKYYAYFVILPDGSYKEVNGERVIENKGIVTAKRGIAKHLTSYYRKCLYAVLMRRSMLDTLNIISEAIELLIRQEVPRENLEAATSVAASYKKKTHLSEFADNMARRGTPVVPGDKFAYIVVQGDKKANVGSKMRLADRYDPSEPIDWEHYILNVLGKPISTLFYLSYFEELEELHHVRYKPVGREGASGLTTVVKTLYRWYRDGGTKEQFLSYIERGKEEAKKPRPYFYVVDNDTGVQMALAAHKKYPKHCCLFQIVAPPRPLPPPQRVLLT